MGTVFDCYERLLPQAFLTDLSLFAVERCLRAVRNSSVVLFQKPARGVHGIGLCGLRYLALECNCPVIHVNSCVY